MKLSSILLASLFLAGPAIAGKPVIIPKAERSVMVLAHRGCWEGGAPEVSVAAIRACAAIGPEMVEVDVRQTRDGALVLIHDETVDRTTNGKGMVTEMTLSQIAALRLRAGAGGPNAPLTGEYVPTLEQGLKAAKGKFILHLHIKGADEAKIAATVRKLGMMGQVTAWVGGRPDSEALAKSPMRGAIALMPIIGQCGTPATGGCWPAPVESLAGFAPYQPAGFYIIPKGKWSDETARRFLKDAAVAPRPAGSHIQVSTLFDADNLPLPDLQAHWRTLIALGAGIIMTDHPGALVDLLRAEKKAAQE